ncbi:hypothetical protein CGRA01v4_13234 [Colletotrichum graminicola]|nr:hypothetical protein CGRA01v4_13234 [Colletotrichum graminicola]
MEDNYEQSAFPTASHDPSPQIAA